MFSPSQKSINRQSQNLQKSISFSQPSNIKKAKKPNNSQTKNFQSFTKSAATFVPEYTKKNILKKDSNLHNSSSIGKQLINPKKRLPFLQSTSTLTNQSMNASKMNLTISVSKNPTNPTLDENRKKLSVNQNPLLSSKSSNFRHFTENTVGHRRLLTGFSCLTKIKSNILKAQEHLRVDTENDFNNSDLNKNDDSEYVTCISISPDLASELNSLESDLDNKLKDKTITKTKKYNIIKSVFNEAIQLFSPENNKLFVKLIVGYHEVMQAFSNEIKELKEERVQREEKCANMEKKVYEVEKELEEKDKEIEVLKKKIAKHLINASKSTNESAGTSSNEKEKEQQVEIKKKSQQEKIEDINRNNLEDLDALYFFDKVKMESNIVTSDKIPLLNFNLEKKIEVTEEEKMNKRKKNMLNRLNPKLKILKKP